ncbi:MAG TPA: aminotransferase class V-fold PLP-dependent enzyme [Pseudonocardiaceae bacterium]|nr:aminotransferase class V-fold PLP-dependent enzyme [Pseudonocardiaceae bacterium]
MTDDDVARARAETPGCAEVVHLNNAGAALPPACVTDTVIGHLRAEALRGGYETADAAAPAIAAAYASIARLLNADSSDIALLDSATTAWQAVFYALPLGPGDRILTCRTEYTSNAISFLQVTRRTGATVEFVADDDTGQLDVADLARRMDDRVKLIALSHVPSHSGMVNPAEAVGEIAERAGVPFLLDACQSAGQLDLDVRRLRCDALSATGRKFLRGPRGTGFLYVGPRLRNALEPAHLDMHSADWIAPDRYRIRPDARRFESWESNVASHLGLGAAVDYALSWGLPAIEERVGTLASYLRARLNETPGVTVLDRGERQCGIVSFTVHGRPADEVKQTLLAAGINTSTNTANNAQYDLVPRGILDLVRASVHYYNTVDELDRLVATIQPPA